MATWLEDITFVLRQRQGVASLSDIYADVRALRPTHPMSFEAIIRRELVSHSADSEACADGKDLFRSVDGIGAGVWGLRDYTYATPEAVDLVDLPAGNESPSRALKQEYRVLRDTKLAREIKVLHSHRCQLCDKTITLADGQGYAEAHHLQPLGMPHSGPDIPGNIVVLFPNHHAMLDLGAIPLDGAELQSVAGHKVDENFIQYHNDSVFRSGDMPA